MKIFKVITTIFYSLILAFVIFVAGSLILNRLNTPIQYKLYSVMSGSMEPTLPVGSLIVITPADDYAKGDIINFRSEGRSQDTVTHRIVDVSRDEDLGFTSYRTKGDANEDPDIELIRSERVNGKVIFDIPYLGYPISFAQTQIGFIALVIIPATLIIYNELLSIKKEITGMLAKSKAKKEEAKTTKVYKKPKIIFKKSKVNTDG